MSQMSLLALTVEKRCKNSVNFETRRFSALWLIKSERKEDKGR